MAAPTLLLLATLLPSQGGDDAAVLSRLNAIWKAQEQETPSARLQFKAFRSGGLAARNRKELMDAIAARDPGVKPDGFKDLIAYVSQEAPPVPPWSVLNLWVKDGKLNEDYVSGGKARRVFDGDWRIDHKRGGGTVELTSRATSTEHIRSLGEFRLLPALEAFTLESPAAGTARLVRKFDDGAERLEVDAADGSVFEFEITDAAGRVIRSVTQRHFKTFTNGIRFPLFVASATYHADGTLNGLSMTLLESAEFNVDVPDSTFRVPVPATTSVVDMRREQRLSYRVREDVPDVVKFADVAVAKRTAADVAEGRVRRKGRASWWLIGAAGTSFVGAVALLLRARNGRRVADAG
jgi:hypothetical protein